MIKAQLSQLLPNDQPVLFFCIGTDRSTGDSLGPLVGTQLKLKGYDVLGTIKSPVHAGNLSENISLVSNKYSSHFIVAIDACLGKMESVGMVKVALGPIQPGAGVGKTFPTIGDMHIKGIVNVDSGLNFLILQSTRLSVVMDMAAEIVECVVKVLPLEHEPFLNFLYRDLKQGYTPGLFEEN